MLKKWYGKYNFLLCCLLSIGLQAQPQISVSTDTIAINAPRFTAGFHELMITNTGNQPLTIEVTDQLVSSAVKTGTANLRRFRTKPILDVLRRRIQAAKTGERLLQLSPPIANTTASVVMISDSLNDVPVPGLDVTTVSYSEDFFSYTFSVEYAGVPETQQLVVLSVDTDQNLATGSFPAPLGLAPVVFDIGSEFDIVFDVGGVPVAFTILTFSGNAVTASFIKAISPGLTLDNEMYAGCIVFSTDTTNVVLPDFAPDYGHGGVGPELGVSWLAQSDTAGFSETPFTAQIAPGETYPLVNIFAAAYPGGSYLANLQIANNSANQPNLIIPVKATVEGLGTALIAVQPTDIRDTLKTDDPPSVWTLQIANNGDGQLVGAIADSTENGEGWLTVVGIPLFFVDPGDTFSAEVMLAPSALTPGNTYQGWLKIFSNAANFPEMEVPVSLTVVQPTGIDGEAAMPRNFVLYDNYPNPFNPSTTIAFDVPQSSAVNISVYNLVGQKIRTLEDRHLTAGHYELVWDGRDERGTTVGSGVFLVEMVAGNFRSVKKMVLLK